jgi:stage II sporulation protein GA (sporulation sigma-E factor processing peptidase)
MTLSDSINQKSAKLIIKLEEKMLEVDALIDTGNLVKDPMNMNPVIFLKKNIAENILPRAIIDLTDIDSLSMGYKKRIRLIPVTREDTTHVMTGVRVDKVIVCNKEREEINATIVIDKEEGTYGGYYALAPYVAICTDA